MEQHDLCLISNPVENSKDRVKGLNSMRKKGIFCDLNIIVQGTQFTVHKSVMATASEYLYNLLKQQESESDGKTTVELNQISVRGFEPLVEFVYTGVLSVKHNQVLEVLSAASFLQMFNVSGKIQAYCNQVLQGGHHHHQQQQQQQQAGAIGFSQPPIAHMLARLFGQNFMQQPPNVQRMAPMLGPHAMPGLPDASAFAAVLNEKFMPSNLANIQNSLRMDDQVAANHKAAHDTLGLEQMIDPVQLQQMRQYAAGIRVNDVKSRIGQKQQQQQQQRAGGVQSQNTKPATPLHHKSSREPKGQYADKIKSLKMSNNNIMMSSSATSAVSTEASRPSSADEITAKKQKMSTDMNRDRSSDFVDTKFRLKRNRSFDTPIRKQEVLAEAPVPAANHNLNNNNNNSSSSNNNNGITLKAPDSPLRVKSTDSSDLTAAAAAVDVDSKEEKAAAAAAAPTAADENSGAQYQQENRHEANGTSNDVPSCSYDQARSEKTQQQQRNGQLMALLQPGESEKTTSKSGKAMVDEFANNVLSQQQEGYRHLLEHFSGDNVIQYLHQQRPHISQPSWMHVGSKQIFQAIKAQNQSPNGSASQREVDLPKLPPSGRYSTVRRRTLQSNKPKPFECKICHSTFTRYHNLKQHVKLHSGIKPYTCHICSKSFTRNYTLKLHRAKHFAKGGSTLRCQLCPASFDDPSAYDTHIRMSHAQMSQYERNASSEELTLDGSDFVSERPRSNSQGSFKANGGYSSTSSQDEDGYKNYYIKQEVNSKEGNYKSLSKVRYGLDSPGGSSGDGMMNGSNLSPNESPSYRGDSDDMPTDLTVMKKGSDDDEEEEDDEELMIAENDHNQQQESIKREVEMQQGIQSSGQ